MDERKRLTSEEVMEKLRIFSESEPTKADGEPSAADDAPAPRAASLSGQMSFASTPAAKQVIPPQPEKAADTAATREAPAVLTEAFHSIPVTRAAAPQPASDPAPVSPQSEKAADTAATREAPAVLTEAFHSIPVTRAAAPQPEKAADTAATREAPAVRTASAEEKPTESAESQENDASDGVGYDWEPLILHAPTSGKPIPTTISAKPLPSAAKPKEEPQNKPKKESKTESDNMWNAIPISRETIIKPKTTPEVPPKTAEKAAAEPAPTREADRVVPAAPVPPVPPRETTPAAEPTPNTDGAAPISLDDFNKDAGSITATTDMKKKKKRSFRGSAGFGVIKLLLYLALVAACVWVLSSFIWNVVNDVFAFIKTDTEVTVYVPEGATTEDIASILKEADVIRYPKVFTAYAKFRISRRDYLTGNYLAGMHTVNPMHNFDTLIEELSSYERSVTGTVRITIPEGLTVNETLELLEENGVGKKEDFLEALQNFEYEYRYAGMLKQGMIADCRFDTNVSYRLEGYLFPDTYEFYLNENPVSAIDKFLVNFDKKFEEEFYGRCEALGMTVDQVITLASLIEKEGNNANDYYLISSVFHNRLSHSGEFPFLNSDAALQYAAGEHMELEEINTSADTPYNTYINRGLPPGPICNPSLEAIYAALYPEDTNYFYFYTKKNGETIYSRNINEHNNVVAADKAN